MHFNNWGHNVNTAQYGNRCMIDEQTWQKTSACQGLRPTLIWDSQIEKLSTTAPTATEVTHQTAVGTLMTHGPT